jgi:hypothetical protein
MASVKSAHKYFLQSAPRIKNEKCRDGRTVYFALVALITNPADQFRETVFPVEVDGDRLVVVTKNTCKRRIYRYFSSPKSIQRFHTYLAVPFFWLDLAFETTFFVCPSPTVSRGE